MDYTIPAAVLSGLIGFTLGRQWAGVRVRLARWGLIDTGRRPQLVRREFRAGPAPVVIRYDAWNAHLLAFARQCAPLERISESAVSSAGIVDRVGYRIMARYMRRCGLWTRSVGPGGRPGKNRWSEWPPYRAMGQGRDGMRAGRGILPYPAGMPPRISPRK